MQYLYLAISIIAEVVGTTFMKQSDGFTRLAPSLITGLAYIIAFYFLSQTLKTMPTGVAYAVWSGAGIVLIGMIAWIVQGQKIDTPGLVGMGLIITGVIVMNVFSSTSAH